ncbi:hypothetical protein OS493_022410 [Desmophyllum pertusum]|uniref:Uncharacterized protein n=1 Tax=Desmophyllum pertusum TaxID=174260 RepID=A0A9W9ZMW5_9CNID|nr:hypothetical protein OS493_022410 [Desmophyllum pertusum]
MSKLYIADSQKGTLAAEVRLYYPATVKIVATGYTNPIAVAMVHGTVIVAERIGNVYCLDLHSKLQVKTASMKKAEMEAFVARQKVHIDHENAKNHSREEFKSAINRFLQSNKKSVTNKGTKLDLEPCVKTPVAMTSLADEIIFIADTGTRRLDNVQPSSTVTDELLQATQTGNPQIIAEAVSKIPQVYNELKTVVLKSVDKETKNNVLQI